MSVEKAREILRQKIAIGSTNADNENYLIPISIKEANEILAELKQPEPNEFTKEIRAEIARGAKFVSPQTMIEACDIIDTDKETIKTQAERIEKMAKENESIRNQWHIDLNQWHIDLNDKIALAKRIKKLETFIQEVREHPGSTSDWKFEQALKGQ